MELSSSNIKKILIFSQTKAFLIFPEMKHCTFQPKLKKLKRFTPRKFLMFQETEDFKKLLIFSQKKAFSYISGNRNPVTEALTSFLYFRR